MIPRPPRLRAAKKERTMIVAAYPGTSIAPDRRAIATTLATTIEAVTPSMPAPSSTRIGRSVKEKVLSLRYLTFLDSVQALSPCARAWRSYSTLARSKPSQRASDTSEELDSSSATSWSLNPLVQAKTSIPPAGISRWTRRRERAQKARDDSAERGGAER